ncbi:MAG: ACT domain-containing protein, partial [Pseudomonadota bacterium]
TPLDFAYQIHTQVGHRCRGAKINGSIANLTQALRNGDQVEILTTREPRPSRDWLNKELGYLKTGRGRAKVRAWFNIQDHDQHVEDGRALLDRELRRLNAKDLALEKLSQKLGYDKLEELLAAIGRAAISVAQIDAAVYALEVPTPQAKPPTRARRRNTKENNDEISVRGVGSLLTQISRCCKPVPYDPIIGYITKGKGVSVHRRDCANILKLKDSDRVRLIEVDWGSEHSGAYPVDLKIVAYDRQGLLRDISQIMADQDINVLAVNTISNQKEQTAHMALTVELYDVDQLALTLEKLRQLPNVLQVERSK